MGSAETSGLSAKFHGIFSRLFWATWAPFPRKAQKPGMNDSAHRITMSRFPFPLRPLCLALAMLLTALPVHAADKGVVPGLKFLDSPKKVTGQFEVGFGWLTLPGAKVCGTTSCSKGDTTPLIEIWNLVHFDIGPSRRSRCHPGFDPDGDGADRT